MSKSGKRDYTPIDFRSLQSRLNLLEAADSMKNNPFGDGLHVIWDQHRMSLIDGGHSFDAESLETLENAINLVRQSSMETWPPPGGNAQKTANQGRRVSMIAANDFFNYMQANHDEDDDLIVGRLATVDAGGADEEDPDHKKSGEAAV